MEIDGFCKRDARKLSAYWSKNVHLHISPGFISNLRLKYGESILVSIRHCERLTEKLQKRNVM
jgi:hypothetical protein